MSHLVLLPSINDDMTEECLATWYAGPVMVVDNTVTNRGVAVSWNIGAQTVLSEGHDHLVVLSAGVRFGAAGGQDFIDWLNDDWACPSPIGIEADSGIGWHLISFSNDYLKRVGLFDERFFPAYYEDNDAAYRAYCEFRLDPNPPNGWWKKVPVDCELVEVAHGLRSGVEVDMQANLAKYVAKHGGPPSHEIYRLTWGRCPECAEFWAKCHVNPKGLNS